MRAGLTEGHAAFLELDRQLDRLDGHLALRS
jgi:hypothetical protein